MDAKQEKGKQQNMQKVSEKEIIKKEAKISPLKGMIFAALFAAFTAAIAPVKIPLGFTPVPVVPSPKVHL